MRAYEFNEVSWWSHWAETKWLTRNAYVIFSRDFDEYFFNRGGFLRITADAEKIIGLMEHEFETRKRQPHFLLQSDQLNSKFLQTLAESGYKIADQMSVLEAHDFPFRIHPDLKIEPVTENGLDAWARIYLDSFYGEYDQLGAVMGIIRRLEKVKDATLLLGTIKGEPAGIAALFRTGRVCGAYCVATQRDWRRIGVAHSMLEHSCRLAASEGRRLILQTVLSDSLEGFYIKLGFKRAYVKDLFVKDEGGVQR